VTLAIFSKRGVAFASLAWRDICLSLGPSLGKLDISSLVDICLSLGSTKLDISRLDICLT